MGGLIMNREVKFRWKLVDSEEWIYGYLREVWGENQRNFVIAPGLKFEYDGYTDKEEDYVQPETIGQFTGFHDQNRKEIYDGDILRFYDNNKEYVCVVGWNNEVGAWCIRFKGEKHVGIRPLGEWIFEYKIEVIGNIYDNKELLEE